MKKIIRALIVDDERLARNALKNKLEFIKDIQVVGEANSVETAVTAITELKPDLIFLDVQLYNETGFDILNKVNYKGEIIFITAYDEYALRAFEVNAVDYLLKPISLERLKNGVNRLQTKTHEKEPVLKYDYNDRILVSQLNSMKFIQLNSIIYISSSGDYSKIYTTNGNYLLSRSMNEWEKRLPSANFFRVHRSSIINIEYVDRAEKWINYSSLIYLKTVKEPLKISRTYLKKFKERFM